MTEKFDQAAVGIRILPGQWRPHFEYEHIAWVSPPWESEDYIWLDFPEAIFCNLGLLYLSHRHPDYPVVFPDIVKVPWETLPDGIGFTRRLPGGIEFAGAVRRKEVSRVSLELSLRNNSDQPLTEITLQTCAYLRAIKEFAEYTSDNKFVHVPEAGWMRFEKARKTGREDGRFRIGWREGPKAADLPVIATLSNQAERLVAMTWYEATYSFVGNRRHPCMHADPFFPDLQPGRQASIRGELIFFEGSLEAFEEWFRREAQEA